MEHRVLSKEERQTTENGSGERDLVCCARALKCQTKEIAMKLLLSVAAVLLVPACSYAQGGKACEELKTEIAAKLDAKGVKGYTLEIVAKDADAEGKVVGTCEAGSKKIVYRKGAVAEKSAEKEPKS
jgi:uncharacterized protein DUF1161